MKVMSVTDHLRPKETPLPMKFYNLPDPCDMVKIGDVFRYDGEDIPQHTKSNKPSRIKYQEYAARFREHPEEGTWKQILKNDPSGNGADWWVVYVWPVIMKWVKSASPEYMKMINKARPNEE